MLSKLQISLHLERELSTALQNPTAWTLNVNSHHAMMHPCAMLSCTCMMCMVAPAQHQTGGCLTSWPQLSLQHARWAQLNGQPGLRLRQSVRAVTNRLGCHVIVSS